MSLINEMKLVYRYLRNIDVLTRIRKIKILNDKGEIKYSNLETNDKGEIDIEGILPGKYYIEEVSTIDGYKLLENKIEFEIALNEELSITITNNKEEITPKKEKSYSERITKLPVTGM